MNKLIFLLVIALLPVINAQIVPDQITPPPPNPGLAPIVPSNPLPVPPPCVLGSAEQIAFDAAYWASKPPAVRKLNELEGGTHERWIASYNLMDRYKIDTQIDAEGGHSPCVVMRLREIAGYTWVPPMSFKPGPPVTPGVWFPPLPYYDPKATAGMILVSTKISDYPTYLDPPK